MCSNVGRAGLVEFYGMTEGGGVCVLEAHRYRHKLSSVRATGIGHDIRLIGEDGNEVPPGEPRRSRWAFESDDERLSQSARKSADAEWFDSTGKRFIRTGDIGKFDADGFLTLVDRKKDMIISGGFNIYRATSNSSSSSIRCSRGGCRRHAVEALGRGTGGLRNAEAWAPTRCRGPRCLREWEGRQSPAAGRL